MSKIISPFPKIWSFGVPELEHILQGNVEITEKLDGSQFSVGRTMNQVIMRSKGAEIFLGTTNKLFKKVVEYFNSISNLLANDVIYYGEVLFKPKHNTLKYNSVPKNNFALFGTKHLGLNWILNPWVSSWQQLQVSAEHLGVSVVPLLYKGKIDNNEQLYKLLETESFLGGTKVEGIVIKNYSQLAVSAFSKECFGKLVRDDFKEKHKLEWKTGTNKVQDFLNQFKTETRWLKAIQYFKDSNSLENDPRDIGKLITYISKDIIVEETNYIKEGLFNLYKDEIIRRSISGFPEFYKNRLVNKL